MPAPNVLSVSPLSNQQDVVLGTPIVVTFDQAIDQTTVTDATFALQGPGQTQILDPEQALREAPDVANGQAYITGTFSFSVNGQGQTVVTFTPSKPLQPNQQYTVLI